MLQVHQGLYIGHDFEEGYLGYIATNDCFLIIAVEEGIGKEDGQKLLESLKIKIAECEEMNLSLFETKISETILRFNIPLHFSLAAGYRLQNVMFLKTAGEGEVYLRRGKEFARLLGGDNRASGYINEYDCFIFTTKRIHQLLGSEEEIKKFVGFKKAEDLANELYAQDDAEEDRGAIGLFIELVREKKDEITIHEQKKFSENQSYLPPSAVGSSTGRNLPLSSKIKGLFSRFAFITGSKRKTVMFTGVIILFIILLWSVVFGHQRRVEADIQKKIETTRQQITKKLDEADNEAFLNISQAESLVGEAKNDLQTLKKELGDKKPQAIADLEQLIKDRENKIMKKEEKNYTEFYDLTLDNKDAQGNKLYLDSDKLAMLDKTNGAIYVLSIPKKSITIYKAGEISHASFVLLNKDSVCFFDQKQGFYQFIDNTKIKKIINQDKDWGNIIDGVMYSGNLYLLDKDKGDIDKYVPVENGYSTKSSYFSGYPSPDLSSASSLAIDSSVYISENDQILKYTRGSREEMKTSFPDSQVHINKVYTNPDLEKVYAWDKQKGTLYLLNKDGTYERQISSSILAQADDFTVFEQSIYILVKQKIYKIDL